MEAKKPKIALYPGCCLEGTGKSFPISLERILEDLDIEYGPLIDWNCCGATSAHALDHKLYLALNLRNLVLAEQQGYDEILAPCAECYHRLTRVVFELDQDERLKQEITAEAELPYQGKIKVRNVLDFLVNVVGVERITRHVKKPLTGLKVACYYGCLNTRVPWLEPFDSVEYPMAMDNIVKALGGETVDWSHKTECCGTSLFLCSEDTAARLVAKILKDAAGCNADCITLSCPLCFNNLDTKQKNFRARFNIDRPLPVVYITQLIGLAFGRNDSEIKMHHRFVPFSTTTLCRNCQAL